MGRRSLLMEEQGPDSPGFETAAAPAPAPEGEATGRPAGSAPGPAAPPTSCPPGQQIINGKCRFPGDNPCPPGQCKDKASGACRSPGKNEKINETDVELRDTGGGRGFCKQREAGAARGARIGGGGGSMTAGPMGMPSAPGGGGGGFSNPSDPEDQYFQRLVDQGDWTEFPPGSGQYFNDPGNDPSQRRWVDRRNLQVQGTGYVSQHDPNRGPKIDYSQVDQTKETLSQYLQRTGQTGSPGGPGGGPGGPAGDVGSLIEQTFRGILGGQTRFSPQVMADIEGKAKLDEQNAVQQGTEALNEDLARRGLSQSPVGASLAQQGRISARQTFDQAMRDTRVQKAKSDFDDKMQGLQQAQQYWKELHDWQLGLDAHSIDRERIQAQLTMARENIASQMEQLMAQLGSQKDLLGMQIDSTEFLSLQRMMLCVQNPSAC